MDEGIQNREFILELLKYKKIICINVSGCVVISSHTCFILQPEEKCQSEVRAHPVMSRGAPVPCLSCCSPFLAVLHSGALLTPQIRKLRRELDASQEKVSALTTQLTANVSTALRANINWSAFNAAVSTQLLQVLNDFMCITLSLCC